MIEDKPDALAALDEIDLSLAAGRNMVSQLLSYAKDTKIRLKAADINVLVSEVLPILGQAAGPISTVATTLAGEEVISLVDEIQFKSSLVNLVLNARDSMPLGGVIAIDVRIAEEAEVNGSPRWIDVNVSDEGTGMTDDVRHQAFDPFFTTKDSGSGSGVGLSQVQDFVRQCSGRVEIFSRKDGGTTIRLRLPLEEIPGTRE
jgi:signal transduction histidine kinase